MRIAVSGLIGQQYLPDDLEKNETTPITILKRQFVVCAKAEYGKDVRHI